MTLLQPLWLWLLPVMLWWWRQRRRSGRGWPLLLAPARLRYPLLAHVTVATQAADAPRLRHADILLGLAMLAALLALAQPVLLQERAPGAERREPVDLILVVGTAISMGLSDYRIDAEPVDRMTLTRRLLDDFVAAYHGRRVGLVVMGDPPALWLPLTDDKALVRHSIARLRTALGGRLTDMGATLRLLQQQFADAENPVVLMVTDGGLQLGEESPVSVAAELAARGFAVYPLVIGSARADVQPRRSGQLLFQAADLSLPRAVARAGNGRLYHVADARAFRQALQDIEAAHRKPVADTPLRHYRQALYPWLLLASALLLVLSVLLAQRDRLATREAAAR